MKAERGLFSLPSRFHVVGITSMQWASLRLRGDEGGGVNSKTANVYAAFKGGRCLQFHDVSVTHANSYFLVMEFEVSIVSCRPSIFWIYGQGC